MINDSRANDTHQKVGYDYGLFEIPTSYWLLVLH